MKLLYLHKHINYAKLLSIREGGKKLVPLPLYSSSISQPRTFVDVGYETTKGEGERNN